MIREHHWEVRELRDMLVTYARSPYASMETKKIITQIKTLSNKVPPKKIDVYLDRVKELAGLLDALYGGAMGYRELHVSEDPEKTIRIDTDRLKNIRALGLGPVFEKIDEEVVRRKFVFQSIDPLLVLTKAVSVMEPLLMEYDTGCSVVLAVKDLKASAPQYTLEPKGRVTMYYFTFADGEKYGKAFVNKLIRLEELIDSLCEEMGMDRKVLPLNVDSGTEAMIVCEYLTQELDRLRDMYCKLIASKLPRMV